MTTLQLNNLVKTASLSKEELTLLALAPVIGSGIGGLGAGGYSVYKNLSGEKEETAKQVKRALKGMGIGALSTSSLAGIYLLSKYLGKKLESSSHGHSEFRGISNSDNPFRISNSDNPLL